MLIALSGSSHNYVSKANIRTCELTAVRVSESTKLSLVVNGNTDRVRLQDTSGVNPSNYHGEHLVGVVLTLLVVKDGD